MTQKYFLNTVVICKLQFNCIYVSHVKTYDCISMHIVLSESMHYFEKKLG